MERTESFVVQVAPSYENAKIQQMEQFGWSLQGRQEMHEEGDAEGAPSIFGDEYVIKTKVSHYVKLHFVRPLSIPNLDRIKLLEAQYFSLPFPNFPRLASGGWFLLMFWWFLWPLWYFCRYKPKKAEAEAQLAETVRKQQEILRDVVALL